VVDVFTVAERSRVMAAVRSRHTGPEMRLAALLRAAGVRYRRHAKDLPGTPDFVLAAFRTIVFVHGCFWHGHGACGKGTRLPVAHRGFWRRKIERNCARDRSAARRLRDRGWSVVTVWECRLAADRLPSRLDKFAARTDLERSAASSRATGRRTA
jgi:DNA mismatch endonuclease, patch repair protein